MMLTASTEQKIKHDANCHKGTNCLFTAIFRTGYNNPNKEVAHQQDTTITYTRGD
jgi:hypothetical protein